MSAATTSHTPATAEPSHHHVVSARLLLAVFTALIVLTAATVAVRFVDLGELNVWVALGVATAKAALVGLYFMHLRYENPLFGLVLLASLAFVSLFMVITLADTLEYAPSLAAPEAASASPTN